MTSRRLRSPPAASMNIPRLAALADGSNAVAEASGSLASALRNREASPLPRKWPRYSSAALGWRPSVRVISTRLSPASSPAIRAEADGSWRRPMMRPFSVSSVIRPFEIAALAQPRPCFAPWRSSVLSQVALVNWNRPAALEVAAFACGFSEDSILACASRKSKSSPVRWAARAMSARMAALVAGTAVTEGPLISSHPVEATGWCPFGSSCQSYRMVSFRIILSELQDDQSN